jgi:hypothetical protein
MDIQMDVIFERIWDKSVLDHRRLEARKMCTLIGSKGHMRRGIRF